MRPQTPVVCVDAIGHAGTPISDGGEEPVDLPGQIATLASEYVAEAEARLPDGISLTVWQNVAESLNNSSR